MNDVGRISSWMKQCTKERQNWHESNIYWILNSKREKSEWERERETQKNIYKRKTQDLRYRPSVWKYLLLIQLKTNEIIMSYCSLLSFISLSLTYSLISQWRSSFDFQLNFHSLRHFTDFSLSVWLCKFIFCELLFSCFQSTTSNFGFFLLLLFIHSGDFQS
jgi:hypothetical protein